MVNLKIEYLGLNLKNPVVVASIGLTAKVENLISYENAGAGAVVLKSLFEEQIENEASFLNEQSALYPENMDYLYNYMQQYSVGNYLNLIKEAKERVSIPVIASINCYEAGNWTSFAKEIEEAGADALEINLYSIATNKIRKGSEIEEAYLRIVKEVCDKVSIPVAVKISQNFSSLPTFVDGLKGVGAKGSVLFNKFFTPDIDINTLSVVGAQPFTKSGDYLTELRWIAIISALVSNFDLSASTGIHSGDEAIKMILSGAKTVQLCSALYKGGAEEITNIISALESFMADKGFSTVEDFRGMLNYSNIDTPEKFERVQFMKTFGSK